MSHSLSANRTPKPSLLLALLAALIVAAYDRRWLARPVSELLGHAEGVSPEYLSRLKARLLEKFEALLNVARRRGRPGRSRGPASDTEARLRAAEALLAVSSALLSRLPVRRRDLQDQIVEAAERLRREHGISIGQFCDHLAIPPRTLRSWRARSATPAPPPPPLADEPKKPAKPSRNPGRFAFEHTLPGLQAAADTTQTRVLGVDLKLIAAQDPGARDESPWLGFRVEPFENSELVIEVLADVAGDQPGLQVLSDQGKPYIARAAREAYEALELDYQPQKEATPTEKAPLERSFGVIKQALAPLLSLTDHLARCLPVLRRPDLAQPLATLFFSLYLRCYRLGFQAGASGGPRLESRELLHDIATEQRERAVAETRSKRLTLEAIHDAYRMEGSREAFVRAHRNHALADIQEAERRIRQYACRCHIRCCDRYFAAVLRGIAETARASRARQRAERIQRRQAEEALQRFRDAEEKILQHPTDLLIRGLERLELQCSPLTGNLIAGGAGIGRADLKNACTAFARTAPLPTDAIEAAWNHWLHARHNRPPAVITAVRRVLNDVRDATLAASKLLTTKGLPSILHPLHNSRPPPPSGLRN